MQILKFGLEGESASQKRFLLIPGSSEEPEKYSDECIDLVSCKISVISTSDKSHKYSGLVNVLMIRRKRFYCYCNIFENVSVG